MARLRWLVLPSTSESVIIRIPEGRAVVALAFEDHAIAARSVASRSSSGAERSHLWDATSGAEIPAAPFERPHDVRLELGSADGGWGAPVRVRDRRGVVVLPTDDETNLKSAAASRDGRRVAAGGYGLECGVIEVWSVSSAQRIAHIDADEHVRAVAMSANGDLVVSGNSRGVVELWRVEGGARLASRKVHEGSVDVIALDDDGRIVTASNEDGSIRVSNPARASEAPTTAHPDAIIDVVFSLDGARLVTHSENGTLWLWDTETGEPIRCLFASTGRVLMGGPARNAIFAGAREIVSLAHGGAMWDAIDGATIADPSEPRLFASTRVAIAPGGENVLTIGSDGVARVGRLRDPSSWGPVGRSVTAYAFSPDGHVLALASANGNVEVLDVAARRNMGTLENGHSVTAIAVMNDGRCLTTDEHDALRGWRVSPQVGSSKPLGMPEGATGVEIMSNARCVTVSPRNDRFTQTVRRWDLRQATCTASFTGILDWRSFAIERAWRALVRERRFVVETDRGEPIASTPTGLQGFTTHPSRPMWAGAVGNDLHWLALDDHE